MIVINLIILALNMGVLALTIKLYTEILKDNNMNQRVRKSISGKTGEA